MLILTVNGLKVLGLVLTQGPVSRLTVNNPINNTTRLSCLHSALTYTSLFTEPKPRKTGTAVLGEKTDKTEPEMKIVEP